MDYASHIFSRPPNDVQKPIFVDADQPSRTISWQEYATYVKRIAVSLVAFGVQDQDAIGLMSDNDIYYYVLGDGVVAAGAIFAPMPIFSKQGDLGNCLKAGLIKYLVAAPKYLDVALATFQELGLDTSRVILFDPPGIEMTDKPERTTFSSLLAGDDSLWTPPAYVSVDPEKPICRRLFTSGTTGMPKAADVSHACSIRRLQLQLPLPGLPEPKALHYIHLFHPSGILWVTGAMLGSHTLYLTSTQDAPSLMDLYHRYGIHKASMTPHMMTALVSCVQSDQRTRESLQSLRIAAVAGSSLRPDLVNAWKELAPKVLTLNGYGSTETHFIAYSLTLLNPPFIGKADRGVEIKIIDVETAETLGEDKEGEICCRSNFLFSGYCNDAKATASTLLQDSSGGGPWCRTGDRGFIDSKTGLLAMTGRFKDLFKVGIHEDVAPAEVEAELMKHPAVADVAITSIKSRDNDNVLECIAYIVRKEGESCTAQDIVQYVASRMSRYKVPTGGVVFVALIPRNAMQKAVKRYLDDQPQLDGSKIYLDIID